MRQFLKYIDVDMPEVGDNDVLIKVHSTSLGHTVSLWSVASDTSGPWPLPRPFQLGRNAAGEIVEVGKNVTPWKVGDRVAQMAHPSCGQCAMCRRGRENMCIGIDIPGHQVFGGYAQYIARSEHGIVRIPANVPYDVAGATMWAYGTPMNVAMRRASTKL
jgi:putative oxidoreductase